MSDCCISIQQATKRFRGRTVLDGISFEVPQGVVFALLGENGAGKSTLIRGLLGFLRFDAGSVRILGMDPVKKPLQIRRQVGYVSDAPAFYEWMTVADAGWYASGFYENGFWERFCKHACEFELPDRARVRDLSKGMRAKLALALALAFNPSLLILDEPTSGLDPIVRRQFLESMVDRAAEGQTVFLSSHQIHEVERVADWVAFLHAGKLRVVAPLEELKSSVTLLSFSMRDVLLVPPVELTGLEVLHRHAEGRTVQLIVRGLEPQLLDGLHKCSNLFDVKTIRPNLEELYLAFTRGVSGEQVGYAGASLQKAFGVA